MPGAGTSYRGRRGVALLVAALALALAACAGDAPDVEESMSELGDDTVPPPSLEPMRVTGYLTTEGSPVVTICGTGEERMVDGPAYLELLSLHDGLAPGVEPMEGVFVDVLATLDEGDRGPVLEVLEVRRAAWEGGGCAGPEPGMAFRAHGTEPFWSLVVRRETLEWRTPDGERTLQHRGPYRSDRGDWVVDGTEGPAAAGSAVAPALSARFYSEPCRDAMSGAWFHMSAEVAFDDREYRGCAYSGDDF